MKTLSGFAFLTLFATAALGQGGLKTPKTAPAADDGTALFRGLFHYHGIRPVTDAPLRGTRETIVVIHGPPANASGWAAELVRTTLAEGGSVLIANRSGGETADLFSGKEAVRMMNGPVVCESPQNCLSGRKEFPLITGTWTLPGTPIEREQRIATDRPGAMRLEDRPRYLTGFSAAFPEGSRFENGRLHRNDVFALGGAGYELNPYRCLVLADQSVFSNRMMYASASTFDDVTPDNFGFANKLVQWLKADGTRKYCVFVENGKIQPRFDDFDFTAIPPPNLPPDMPMPPIPNPLDRPIQEGLAKTIDNGLARVEDDNQLNRVFTGDNHVYGWILRIGLVFLLVAGLVLFAFRTWRSRHTPSFQPLPVDALMLGGDAPLGSFEHRRLELLRGGDFRAPVVAYLRRLFAERGGGETAGHALPPLDIRARNRGDMKRMIRELWDEAFVFDREPLPYTRWKEIEPSLAAVRAAADAGLWKFRSAQANSEDA